MGNSHYISRIPLPNPRPLTPPPTPTITQPQRINPPRRIQPIPIPVQSPRQLQRILRQIPPNVRVVVPMPVVMQPCLRVEILTLKPQWLIQHLIGVAVEAGQSAMGGVLRRPDYVAAVVGQFLRRTKVV